MIRLCELYCTYKSYVQSNGSVQVNMCDGMKEREVEEG